jgi:hypothetical protein
VGYVNHTSRRSSGGMSRSASEVSFQKSHQRKEVAQQRQQNQRQVQTPEERERIARDLERVKREKADAEDYRLWLRELREKANPKPKIIPSTTMVIHEDGFVDSVLDADISRMRMRQEPIGKVMPKEKPVDKNVKPKKVSNRTLQSFQRPKPPENVKAVEMDEFGRGLKMNKRDYTFNDTEESKQFQAEITKAFAEIPYNDIERAKLEAENSLVSKEVSDYIKKYYPLFLKQLLTKQDHSFTNTLQTATPTPSTDSDYTLTESDNSTPPKPSASTISPLNEVVSLLANEIFATLPSKLITPPSEEIIKKINLPHTHLFTSPDPTVVPITLKDEMVDAKHSWYQCPIGIDGDQLSVNPTDDTIREQLNTVLKRNKNDVRLTDDKFNKVWDYYHIVKENGEKQKQQREQAKQNREEEKEKEKIKRPIDIPGQKPIRQLAAELPEMPAFDPNISFTALMAAQGLDLASDPHVAAKKIMEVMKETPIPPLSKPAAKKPEENNKKTVKKKKLDEDLYFNPLELDLSRSSPPVGVEIDPKKEINNKTSIRFDFTDIDSMNKTPTYPIDNDDGDDGDDLDEPSSDTTTPATQTAAASTRLPRVPQPKRANRTVASRPNIPKRTMRKIVTDSDDDSSTEFGLDDEVRVIDALLELEQSDNKNNNVERITVNDGNRPNIYARRGIMPQSRPNDASLKENGVNEHKPTPQLARQESTMAAEAKPTLTRDKMIKAESKIDTDAAIETLNAKNQSFGDSFVQPQISRQDSGSENGEVQVKRKKTPSALQREKDLWYAIRKLQQQVETDLKNQIQALVVEKIKDKVRNEKLSHRSMPNLFHASVSHGGAQDMSELGQNRYGVKM